MSSYQLGLNIRSAVYGGAGRPTDLRKPAGHTIARGRSSTKPQSISRGRAQPSSGDICPPQRRQDAESPQVSGAREERDDGWAAEEEALLQLLMKKKNGGGVSKSKPVAARSHAAWPVGTSTSPSQPAHNSAASVAVSSLGMGSAVSSEASGSESNAKVSPAPLVQDFLLCR